MKIGCLQFAPKLGEVAHNLTRADAVLTRVSKDDLEQLDLLVAPEMAFSGYNFKSSKDIVPHLEVQDTGISSLWARAVALKHNCTVVVGYPEKVDGVFSQSTTQYYNSAVIINSDGELIGNHRKHHLYMTDETWAQEGSSFFQGKLPVLGNTTLGICMDINPYKFLAPWTAFEFAYHVLEVGANLVIVSMAWVTREEERTFTQLPEEPDMESLTYWCQRMEPLIRSESSEEIIIVLCNRTGVETDAVYVGTSTVLGIKQGEVRVYGLLGRGEKRLLVVDTEKAPIGKLVSRNSEAQQAAEALSPGGDGPSEAVGNGETSTDVNSPAAGTNGVGDGRSSNGGSTSSSHADKLRTLSNEPIPTPALSASAETSRTSPRTAYMQYKAPVAPGAGTPVVSTTDLPPSMSVAETMPATPMTRYGNQGRSRLPRLNTQIPPDNNREARTTWTATTRLNTTIIDTPTGPTPIDVSLRPEVLLHGFGSLPRSSMLQQQQTQSRFKSRKSTADDEALTAEVRDQIMSAVEDGRPTAVNYRALTKSSVEGLSAAGERLRRFMNDLTTPSDMQTPDLPREGRRASRRRLDTPIEAPRISWPTTYTAGKSNVTVRPRSSPNIDPSRTRSWVSREASRRRVKSTSTAVLDHIAEGHSYTGGPQTVDVDHESVPGRSSDRVSNISGSSVLGSRVDDSDSHDRDETLYSTSIDGDIPISVCPSITSSLSHTTVDEPLAPSASGITNNKQAYPELSHAMSPDSQQSMPTPRLTDTAQATMPKYPPLPTFNSTHSYLTMPLRSQSNSPRPRPGGRTALPPPPPTTTTANYECAPIPATDATVARLNRTKSLANFRAIAAARLSSLRSALPRNATLARTSVTVSVSRPQPLGGNLGAMHSQVAVCAM